MDANLYSFVQSARPLFREMFTAPGYYQSSSAVDELFARAWTAWTELHRPDTRPMVPLSEPSLCKGIVDIFQIADAVARIAAIAFGGQSSDYWSEKYREMREEFYG